MHDLEFRQIFKTSTKMIVNCVTQACRSIRYTIVCPTRILLCILVYVTTFGTTGLNISPFHCFSNYTRMI